MKPQYLFDKMVEEFEKDFSTSTIHGVPLTELSKEELMAVCCFLVKYQGLFKFYG